MCEITEVFGILVTKLQITDLPLSSIKITEVSVFSFYRWLATLQRKTTQSTGMTGPPPPPPPNHEGTSSLMKPIVLTSRGGIT